MKLSKLHFKASCLLTCGSLLFAGTSWGAEPVQQNNAPILGLLNQTTLKLPVVMPLTNDGGDSVEQIGEKNGFKKQDTGFATIYSLSYVYQPGKLDPQLVFSPDEEFVATLDAIALEKLAKNEPVNIKDLKSSQQEILKTFYSPTLSPQKVSSILDTGVISLKIAQTFCDLVVSGIRLDKNNLDNGNFSQSINEIAEVEKKNSIEEQIKNIDGLTDEPISIDEPRSQKVREWADFLFPNEKQKIIASKDLSDVEIVVSQGKFTKRQLLGAVAAAAGGELRKLEDSTVIAPKLLPIDINGDSEFTLEAELFWEKTHRAFETASLNTSSNFSPFEKNAVMALRLQKFSALSVAQQERALQQAHLTKQEIEPWKDNIQCMVVPILACEIKYLNPDTDKTTSVGFGFSPREYYGWWLMRTQGQRIKANEIDH